ncbi:uracil phosphoribosyltransferase [Nitzschia inconspicua]|uniref:Uracil phosphoribosyltransferase n=1 Tax=Nitzschia inconspicua TaxID=303405 RepID=A0A9K3LJG1_9STRA|nr:uracil phosphoribosyltransferase [Nitzschia inconspicua]
MSNTAADNNNNNDVFGPNIHISSHPVLFHKISILRSATTTAGTFRSVLRELTYHLGYEATKDLKTKTVPVTVSFGKESEEEHVDCDGYKLVDRVSLIPILRSGLGMMDGMLELLPTSAVYHIGMYRIPGHAPVQYFNRLPRKCESDVAIVLDPVIASSATSTAVIGMLKKWGVPKIHLVSVLASHEGLSMIQAAHPDVYVTVGMVDHGLTSTGIVLPGLGDCGDRLFGTQHMLQEGDENGDNDLVVPLEKRKRSNSVDASEAMKKMKDAQGH